MFCPKCGTAEQSPGTYCRQCGEFLPDLTKRKMSAFNFGGDTPEEQIRTSLILNALSAAVSLALAIALYWTFLGTKADPLIYLTAAFLLAMSAWQFSTCVIGLKLRKKFTARRENLSGSEVKNAAEIQNAETGKLLAEADLSNVVPTSITENTTKTLSEKVINRSS